MTARRFIPCRACPRPSAFMNGLCPICDAIASTVYLQPIPFVDYTPRRAA